MTIDFEVKDQGQVRTLNFVSFWHNFLLTFNDDTFIHVLTMTQGGPLEFGVNMSKFKIDFVFEQFIVCTL